MAAHPIDDRESEDLTARARIRDAALHLFAEHGIGGTTIRHISAAAGVSAGLVRHHFGSKEALRDACDAHALDRLMRIKEKAVFDGSGGNPAFMTGAHPTVLLLMRYLARSMVDGSPAAAALFDQMVDLTEAWVTRHHPEVSADPRAYAGVLVAMQMGPLVMHDHLSRALGADILSTAGHLRMSKAVVDFYAHPLLSPEVAAQAHEAMDRLQERPSPTAEPRSAD
ncbi:MAG TPA: TetR family transcriptional regulator [Micromonosporaceae bacterium]|nr:TetR family transcriptional regulator [Micromonosporaceae bacterium]